MSGAAEPATSSRSPSTGSAEPSSCPIPAASAVKIDGERAYRLHRQGTVVEMPVRAMRIHELSLLGYESGVARLELLVGSGTYIRSIADALGGHCVELRRTEIGPFAVARGRPGARDRHRGGSRPARDRPRAGRVGEAGDVMRIAHTPAQVERQPRAVAIGTFDGVHRGHVAVLKAATDTGLAPTAITFDPHPRIALGNRVELITTLERRLELLAGLGVETTVVLSFTPELMRLLPEQFAESYLASIGAEAVAAGPDFRFGAKRSGDLDLLGRLGYEVLDVEPVGGVSSTAIRSAPGRGRRRRRSADARAPVRARRSRRDG